MSGAAGVASAPVEHADAHGASAAGPSRIEALDLARGAAIALMVLSHGVKGLLEFEDFPPWGLVPVHAITKFASSLFIIVFGISVAVAYGRHVGEPTWPSRRRRMLIRGVTILFWYKILTIAEMTPRFSEREILDTLLYRSFTVFVEILGFYGLALLWLPFVLPLWKRLPLVARLAVPPLLAALSFALYHRFDFWGSAPLQALLVEHESFYTWGQLARAPLIFLGLIVGDVILGWRAAGRLRLRAAALFGSASLVLFASFAALAGGTMGEALVRIAHNAGKHPPELEFMLFSMGGACLVLALSFLGGAWAAKILRPVTMLGRDALQAFVAHAFVLCVFYRYLLGYWHAVDYGQALRLTAILFALSWLWVEVLQWLRRSQRPA